MKSGIYMWTSPSGKSYIGQAVDLDKRKSNFLSFGTRYAGSKINNARRKYNNIQYWTYAILEYCDIDDLDEREEYYISLYNTMRKGYNCESGGNENKIVSDEVKRKISESRKGKCCGEKNPNYRKHLTEEQKRKMSKAKKGENNPMYGKHRDDETKSKLSEVMKGKYCGEKHPMWGKHLTEEQKRKISEALKGEKHPMWGKHLDDETKDKIRLRHNKPVIQFTKEGTFVAEYESTLVAKNITGINSSNISKCCLGKRKSAGGFKWAYKNPPLLKKNEGLNKN